MKFYEPSLDVGAHRGRVHSQRRFHAKFSD